MSNETSARVEGESGARIFLDCDGVLADFDSYAEKIFGLPPRKAEEKLGAKRFWCDLQSHDGFYRNLPLMPDAQELFDAVAHLNPIILTGLPLGDWAEPQKREWGAKHFPHTTMICCMSADKRNHMKPGDILIDDFLKYKSLWVEAGGIFIHHTSTRASLAELKKLGILPEAKPEPLPNTEIIQSATICEHGYYNNNCCPKCHNIPVTGPLPNTLSTREEPCEWNGRIFSDHHDLVNMHGGGSRCVKCKKEWLAAIQEMPAPNTLQEERVPRAIAHTLWYRGSRLHRELKDSLTLHPEIWHAQQMLDQWSEIATRYASEILLAAPKVVDSKEDQDLSPLREDTVVFRYDGLEAITQACGLLDVIKQEWAEMWTDHDQAVREGLSRILSTSVVEQGGEQQRPGPTAGFRYKVHIETKTGWRKHNCYTQEEVFSILRGMQSDEVLVSITGPESVAPSPLPKQEFCNEVRPGFKNAKSHGCVLMAGHDEGYHCNGQNVRWNASRAAAPVGPARTDLEKGLLNALYEVMPYLKETSRYKLLAPICHEALRLAGDDWAAPVALPTHREVERTIADDDYVGLRCSCGRIFVGLGDEALASSRASFEAHLPRL